jgi:hypothetical protein
MGTCCNCGQHCEMEILTPPHVVLSYPAKRDGEWVRVYKATYAARCGCGERVITKRGPLELFVCNPLETSELRLAYDPL